MSGDAVLEVDGLSVGYGEKVVLAEVSLTLKPGTITALVGPNGAGKSTFMRTLFGEQAALGGSVRVCGLNPFEPDQRRRLWTVARWVQDEPIVYDELTVAEFLAFMAHAFGVPREMIEPKAKGVADDLDLTRYLNTRIGELSFGNRRKVHVAGGLFSGADGPRLLVLDEPTVGMDPPSRLALTQLMAQYVRGGGMGSERAALISSHNLSELSGYADHALILADGKVVASGSIDELDRARDEDLAYELVFFEAVAEEAAAALTAQVGAGAEVIAAHTLRVVCDDRAMVAAMQALFTHQGARFALREMRRTRTALERVFIEELDESA